jgi:hypothetical protein
MWLEVGTRCKPENEVGVATITVPEISEPVILLLQIAI